MLYYVITTVFNDIYYTLNIDFVPEDKILIENLERDFSILHEQYRKRSKENFDLYYGKFTPYGETAVQGESESLWT